MRVEVYFRLFLIMSSEVCFSLFLILKLEVYFSLFLIVSLYAYFSLFFTVRLEVFYTCFLFWAWKYIIINSLPRAWKYTIAQWFPEIFGLPLLTFQATSPTASKTSIISCFWRSLPLLPPFFSSLSLNHSSKRGDGCGEWYSPVSEPLLKYVLLLI